ncbi:hypothetical protein V2G26_001943 [Clonostachys chloroleuca]
MPQPYNTDDRVPDSDADPNSHMKVPFYELNRAGIFEPHVPRRLPSQPRRTSQPGPALLQCMDLELPGLRPRKGELQHILTLRRTHCRMLLFDPQDLLDVI